MDRSNTTCSTLTSAANTHRALQHTATPLQRPQPKEEGNYEKGKPANQGNLRHSPAPRPSKPGMSKVPEATTCQQERLRPQGIYG